METNQIDTDKPTEMGLMGTEVTEVKMTEPELPESEWVIRRPKRAKITEEAAIKWTEEFAAKRKERFIASIRKSKS